ncbi:kinase-like domain-containing protein [Rhypophila decipiens]|uniref:Kinase-like domain-containing protein n=1 Tax=Rhypophila decipiens TaxID=261697 RepID=A0AAN6Y052_9PEZI|nr:kinase-like domain-containing protein [Rhypophila decipiens]
MPINASFTLESTIGQSLFPIRRGQQTEFAFWDAVQHSSLLSQFSKLQFKRRLGEGATFLVDLFEDPDDDASETDNETHPFVAVKTAKVPVGYDGTGGTMKEVDLYSLLLEIQVLQHDPLVSHPNIIDILGMDWTISETGVQVPRVVVEYATYGTLNAFLHDHGKGVGLTTRLEIWSDISMGLEMLHRCQLVHGDMKLLNILVFRDSGTGRGVVAKLSDFGGTLTDFDLEPEQIYRGSNGYRAPELTNHLSMGLAELQKCDIFALGLCFWEILDNGEPYYKSTTGCFGSLSEGRFLDSDLNCLLSPLSGRITNPIQPHPKESIILKHSREFQLAPNLFQVPISSVVNHLLRQMLQPNPRQRVAAGTVIVKLERLMGRNSLNMLTDNGLFVNPLRRSKLPTYVS